MTMVEPCHELWRVPLGSEIRSLAITSDGELILAATVQGSIFCFDRGRELRWRHEVGAPITSLALAEAARRLLVGSTSPHPGQLLDFDGQVLSRLDGCGAAVALAPDTQLLICIDWRDQLRGYDQSGSHMWTFNVGGRTSELTVAPDGQSFAYALEGKQLELRTSRGRRVWLYRAHASLVTPVRYLPRGQGVVVCSQDRTLHCVSLDGKRRWVLELPERARALEVALAGHEIAVGTENGMLIRISNDGTILWRHRVCGDVTRLAVSVDGRFLAGYARHHGLLLLDCEYDHLWQHQGDDELHHHVLTPDGRLLATASNGGVITLFENPAAQPAARPEEWRKRRLIRQLRRQFSDNRFLGIAGWFDEFDRSLQQGELSICTALLHEIRDAAYGLDADGMALVDSREAALLLHQGLDQQRQGEHAAAGEAYEQSLKIHQRLGHREGEGQALAALATLDQPLNEVHEVLSSLSQYPMVLGSSDSLLTSWLSQHALDEQLDIIRVAARLGMAQPLLNTVMRLEGPAQLAAAAALAYLDPGPTFATVATMLESERWFIRWLALVIFAQQVDKQEQGWQLEELAPALDAIVERREVEPMVRREQARLLGAFKDPAHTASLIAMLRDDDAEVRLAAADALASCGTRQALTVLSEVADGNTLTLHSPRAAAAEAVRAIERRHPLPHVQDLWFRRGDAVESQPAYPQRLFVSIAGVIEAVVTLSHPSLGSGVIYRLYHEGHKISEEAFVTTPDTYCHILKAAEPLVRLVDEQAPEEPAIQKGAHDAIRAGLVELLDGVSQREQHRGDQSRQLRLALAPVGERWQPGTYELEVSLEGKRHRREIFRVVEAPVIKDLLTYPIASANGPIRREMSAVFTPHMSGISAIIQLDDAPLGIEITGQLQVQHASRVLAECRMTTTSEGYQELLLQFPVDEILPNVYQLVVSGAGAIAGWRLKVVERVSINRIVMCDDVDAELRPQQEIDAYSVKDCFVCVVETGEVPPEVAFTASWYADGQLMTEPSRFHTRVAGIYRIAFTLQHDGQVWLPGLYEVVVRGPDAVSSHLSFRVYAELHGLNARISRLLRRSRPENNSTFACFAKASGVMLADSSRVERIPMGEVQLYATQRSMLTDGQEQSKGLRSSLSQDEHSQQGPVEHRTTQAREIAPVGRSAMPEDLVDGLVDQFREGARSGPPVSKTVPTQPDFELIESLRSFFSDQKKIDEERDAAQDGDT